ncbi:MAG TPA: ABC transporter ATP-binding protein [Erythrobacter sp.]|nr:ABC transporter ATP-binding protein [Erythrobacter sp.]
MLELQDAYAGYGDAHALFGVSISVKPGEAVGLLGRNGAGKSTTLKTIMGLVPLARGRLMFLDRDVTGMRTFERSRLGLGYVPEDRRIFPELTVRENLDTAVKPATDGTPWTLDRVFDLFPALGGMQKRAGGLLSGGEQQMLSIARTLMGNPRLLLLDEPSEGLAPLVIGLLRTQILRLKEEGITIMLCEQNLRFAMAICDRVYVIDTGQIGFAGTFEELESNPEVKRAHLMV